MTTAKKAKKAPARKAGQPRIVGYMRCSTDSQDVRAQQTGILEYAKANGLQPIEFVEEQISGRVAAADRKLGKELIPSLNRGDQLIVGEISRIGRTLRDVLNVLHQLAERGVVVHVVKGIGGKLDQSMQSQVFVQMLGLVAQIEAEMIRSRTKEGMARARAEGKTLGRPKGSWGPSKLDPHEAEIKNLAKHGAPLALIARMTNSSWGTARRFMQRRGIKVERPGARR